MDSIQVVCTRCAQEYSVNEEQVREWAVMDDQDYYTGTGEYKCRCPYCGYKFKIVTKGGFYETTVVFVDKHKIRVPATEKQKQFALNIASRLNLYFNPMYKRGTQRFISGYIDRYKDSWK